MLLANRQMLRSRRASSSSDSIAHRNVDLWERTISAPSGAVDRAAGVIRGARVLGSKSKNGYEYTESAMRSAVERGLYEGVRVYVDHTLTGRRVLDDLVGVLRNAQYRDGGIYADVHLRKECSRFAEICESAERFPNSLGLSHHAKGTQLNRGGRIVVDRIEAVHSVDIVPNPATNSSLFESTQEPSIANSREAVGRILRGRGGATLLESEGTDHKAPQRDEMDLDGLLKTIREVAITTPDSQARELLSDALRQHQNYCRRCGETPTSQRLVESIVGLLRGDPASPATRPTAPTSTAGIRGMLLSRR